MIIHPLQGLGDFEAVEGSLWEARPPRPGMLPGVGGARDPFIPLYTHVPGLYYLIVGDVTTLAAHFPGWSLAPAEASVGGRWALSATNAIHLSALVPGAVHRHGRHEAAVGVFVLKGDQAA